MLFRTSSIAVEIKKKPAGNELLVQMPKLRMMAKGEPVQEIRVVKDKHYLWKGREIEAQTILVDPETKKPVPSSEVLEVMDHYRNVILNPRGEEVKDDDVQYFVLAEDGSIAKNEDGTDKEVKPFDLTDTIEILDENWVPSIAMDGFEICNVYEIYAASKNGVAQLLEEAEKRARQDQVGVTTFSFGNGFKQYYAFLVPFFHEGKFVWLMKLSDKKCHPEHLEDIPTTAKVPIREVPTLSTLPPLQALVIPLTPKKKK